MTREKINKIVLARKNSLIIRILGRIRDLFAPSSLTEELGRLYLEDVGVLFKDNKQLEQKLRDTNIALYDAKHLNDQLDQKVAALQRQVSEFVNHGVFTEEQVKKLSIQPGDFLVIHHEASNYSYGHNGFGYGLAALQYLQEELSRMVGGKVFIVAHKGQLDVQKFTLDEKAVMLKELKKSLKINGFQEA